MTIDEVAVAANQYQNIPDGSVNLADRVAWWSLRSIYEDNRRGVISKEAGVEMKRNIISQHIKDTNELAMLTKVEKYQAEQWRRIEQAAETYAKSATGRTPEGDALFTALYGPVLKDGRNENG